VYWKLKKCNKVLNFYINNNTSYKLVFAGGMIDFDANYKASLFLGSADVYRILGYSPKQGMKLGIEVPLIKGTLNGPEQYISDPKARYTLHAQYAYNIFSINAEFSFEGANLIGYSIEGSGSILSLGYDYDILNNSFSPIMNLSLWDWSQTTGPIKHSSSGTIDISNAVVKSATSPNRWNYIRY
jgi:hypothetical protein